MLSTNSAFKLLNSYKNRPAVVDLYKAAYLKSGRTVDKKESSGKEAPLASNIDCIKSNCLNIAYLAIKSQLLFLVPSPNTRLPPISDTSVDLFLSPI